MNVKIVTIFVILIGLGIWLILAAVSYSRQPSHVIFELADGFSGIVRVRFGQKEGVPPVIRDRTMTITVPESGLLSVNYGNPFRNWTSYSAKTRSGRSLQVASTSKPPAPEAVCFRWVGHTPDATEIWVIIGDAKQEAAATVKMHEYAFESARREK